MTDYHPEYQPGYTYGTQDYDPYYGENYGRNHDSGIRQSLSDLPPDSGHVTRDNGPNVITYEDTVTLEPWTPGWYDYCSSKYRSFNPKRGTFLGYDGKHHFCVAK